MVSTPDGYSRLGESIITSMHPDFISYVWLPGNKTILSSAINLGRTQSETPARVESWITMPLTALFLSLTVYRLSLNIPAALFAFAFFLVNPISIYLSSQTLSENNWILSTSISIFFLCQKKPKLWLIGFLFWSFSQTIRYESWYLTPILIFVFHQLHHHKKATLLFAISSFMFPAYWLIRTKMNTGTYLTYWNEKMAQAAKGPPDIYFQLSPSFTAWYLQLKNLFSQFTLLIFLICSINLFRRKNFLSIIGIMTFFALVIQVYLGTMEYFPVRYLSLVSYSVICTIIVAINHRRYPLLTSLIFVLIFTFEFIHLPKRLQAITEKPLITIIDMSNFYKTINRKSSCNEYLIDPSNYTFSESTIPYFFKIPLENFNKINIDESQTDLIKNKCNFFIDKGFNNIINPKLQPYLKYKIYENENFIFASTAAK